MAIVYYTNIQVEKLLNEILDRLPKNDNKLINIRNFIEDKKININKHI